jgi:hypothetical protein
MAPLCVAIAGWLVGAAVVLAAGRWDYGFGLFVLTPAVAGATTSAVGLFAGVQSFLRLSLMSLGSLALGGIALVLGQMEGLLCIGMSAAVVVIPVLVGVAIGYAIKAIADGKKKPPPSLPLLVLLILPPTAWDELHNQTHSDRITYSTSVEIKAPPTQVWSQIVDLGTLPPAHDWMANLGLACPETTQLKGNRVGAERDCRLSTGLMRERITEWDPQRKLAFVALETPPPMKELNPFGDPHPAHLKKDYFQIIGGEFTLEPILGGTRLTRATTYTHQIRPAIYWTWWCNLAADYAHHRVLDYLKTKCEDKSPFVALK